MRLLKSKRILDNTNTLVAKLVPWIESLQGERPSIAYIINVFGLKGFILDGLYLNSVKAVIYTGAAILFWEKSFVEHGVLCVLINMYLNTKCNTW